MQIWKYACGKASTCHFQWDPNLQNASSSCARNRWIICAKQLYRALLQYQTNLELSLMIPNNSDKLAIMLYTGELPENLISKSNCLNILTHLNLQRTKQWKVLSQDKNIFIGNKVKKSWRSGLILFEVFYHMSRNGPFVSSIFSVFYWARDTSYIYMSNLQRHKLSSQWKLRSILRMIEEKSSNRGRNRYTCSTRVLLWEQSDTPVHAANLWVASHP